jgi:phage terminase small subunit
LTLEYVTQINADLTPNQFRFVEEYLLDPTNLKQCAIRAGYTETNASARATQLMNDPKVRAAIDSAQQARAHRMGITQERVLKELALIAFSNLKDIITVNEDGTTSVDMKNMPRDIAAALSEVSMTMKGGKVKSMTAKAVLNSKMAALEKLGKHLGIFVDKVEHTGTLTLEQLVAESMNKDNT